MIGDLRWKNVACGSNNIAHNSNRVVRAVQKKKMIEMSLCWEQQYPTFSSTFDDLHSLDFYVIETIVKHLGTVYLTQLSYKIWSILIDTTCAFPEKSRHSFFFI